MKGKDNKNKKKVALITLGCKTNQYETNAMAQKLEEAGYEIVDVKDKPQITIINTCTVTNIADRKSRQQLRKMKQENPDTIIVATGCYAQVAKEELEKIEEIDLIIGNTEKKEIVKYIENHLCKVTDINKEKEYTEFGITTYTEKARATIKIQDGCNNFCSYCLIPFARGRIRSREPEHIIEEAKQVVEKGIKEIVLTGIHIALYGKEKEDGYSLIDLLEELNKVEKIKRIRLGSLEPTLITDEFVERLKKLEKICNQFHLSLQSGCNSTLKRMNRKYTTQEFEKVVERLRKNFDNVNLTTDIIVGFPGETDEEFEETYNFLKKIEFYKMHIFKYSKREGTVASAMQNQIDGVKKEQRSQRLIELSNQNEKKYNEGYINKQLEVLFEEEQEGLYVGHTKNYIVVKTKSNKNIENEIKNVIGKKVIDNYILGEIV